MLEMRRSSSYIAAWFLDGRGGVMDLWSRMME